MHRRKRNTGTIVFRDSGWVCFAPQHTRGAKQLRVAKESTYAKAARALDAWLNGCGRIVRRDVAPEKRSRSIR